MINKEFFSALEALETEKDVKKETFIEILETALTSAYKKHFGEAKSAYVKLIPEKNTIKVFAYKTVVDEVIDKEKQISVEDAKLISNKYKLGDTIIEEVTPKDFGRIAAQTAKHIILQKLNELEKEKLLKEINGKESELVTGVVKRLDGKNVFIELGGTNIDAVMNEFEQVPGEKYKVGQKIKVFVKQIKDTPFGPQISVSRKNVGYVKRLIELEVPEIEAGEIVIKAIVRDAGSRTKVAVQSLVKGLDAVGACIGAKGNRINTLMNELNGERIDVIPYDEDIFNFIASALCPAEVLSVEINNDTMQAVVIVPEDKLSLAIGKGGQNVKLASKLTGWRIDVKVKGKDEELLESTDNEEFALDNDKISQEESVETLDDIENVEIVEDVEIDENIFSDFNDEEN